jgi:hypothetical protein
VAFRNDRNLNRRSFPMTDDARYTGWMVGGAAVFAIILGLTFVFGSADRTITAADRAASTDPVTTASAVPVPMSGQGTADASRQNPPPAPAR